MRHVRAKAIRIFTVIGAISLYPLSYVALSLNGIYYPAVIGLNGVKWYDWAPLGSYSRSTYEWRMPMLLFYFPLWYADKNYWHKSDLAYSGDYPRSKLFEQNEK